MLGDLNVKIQLYIKAARENGAADSTRIVMSAAKGIVTKFARHRLSSYGGHIEISKTWARSLLRRMGYTQRKGTKGIKHLSTKRFWHNPDQLSSKNHRYHHNWRHSWWPDHQLGPNCNQSATLGKLDYGKKREGTSSNTWNGRQTPLLLIGSPNQAHYFHHNYSTPANTPKCLPPNKFPYSNWITPWDTSLHMPVHTCVYLPMQWRQCISLQTFYQWHKSIVGNIPMEDTSMFVYNIVSIGPKVFELHLPIMYLFIKWNSGIIFSLFLWTSFENLISHKPDY